MVDQGGRFDDRQRIWEAIYPESGMGKAPKNKTDRKNEIISFSNHAAEALGITPRTVQHLTKVGRLPDDIKDLVRGAALGDHLVNLLKLARIKDAKEQRVAALSCEAAATIGDLLDPTVTQGQRTDLTFSGVKKLPAPTATRYRKIARLLKELRQTFYEQMRGGETFSVSHY